MVTKVKKNMMKIRSSLPEDSQNSASPYHLTAKRLMALCESANKRAATCWWHPRVEDDAGGAHGGERDVVAPVLQDQVEGGDLEGNQDDFVEVEGPAGGESKGLVNPLGAH